MKSRKTIGEYTWVSAAQYIQWLELNCQLVEVDITSIWSMRVMSKTGIKGLLSRKVKLANTLKQNRKKLESFTLETRELALEEVDVIAAFVGNIDSALVALDEQMGTLTHLINLEQERMVFEYEDVEEPSKEVLF